MTDDRSRQGDWNREEWVGAGQAGNPGPADREPDTFDEVRGTGVRDAELRHDEARADSIDDGTTGAGAADRWNKTQWVGDQGHGAPSPVDPDAMPEGESRFSGDRHNPGEEHWARGQSDEPREDAGDRPLER